MLLAAVSAFSGKDALMRRFIAAALAAGVVAAPILMPSPAQARHPIKSISTFGARIEGGFLRSPHLKITVSITGRYSFVRKYHGHRHTFYGLRVSAQHCKPDGCWGTIKHGKLPVAYPRGKAVDSRTAVGIPCWVHACVNPVNWAKNGAKKAGGFSNWLGHADEWFFKNLTLPCLTGVGGGWVNTQREQLSRRFALFGGWMSRAKYAAGVAGPEDYAVAGVAGCSLTLSGYGAVKARTVAKKLGIQVP
jgi:hypothetical protein